jgi:N-acetyl-gamma-glutamyl-phosphate reductase
VSRPVRIVILGAGSYGAGELLRLLTQHPAAEVVCVTSTSHVGQPVSRVHPHLRGFYDQLIVSELIDLSALLEGEHRFVVSALPHGVSGEMIRRVLTGPDAESLRFVDLSGDLRLSDLEAHRRYYPESAALPELRSMAAYGMPELGAGRIRQARIVANPGCLASAAILAVAPLFRGTRASPAPTGDGPVAIAVDAKTGSSGSGRKLKETTHHPTRHADFRAYKPLAHQHEPEILQALGDANGGRVELSFVAQSMDAARGIFATAHLTLPRAIAVSELLAHYRSFYAASPFVRVREDSPTLQDVVGSNFCDVSVACRGRQVIAMAALDNLIKGMAGAAIQNMNLMAGLEETTGLWTPALRPV